MKFRALFDDPASPCSRRTSWAQVLCCAKRLVGELAPVSIALRSEVAHVTYPDVPTHLLACLHTGAMPTGSYERSTNALAMATHSEDFRGLEYSTDGGFFEPDGEFTLRTSNVWDYLTSIEVSSALIACAYAALTARFGWFASLVAASGSE